jgi:hypothetical protein
MAAVGATGVGVTVTFIFADGLLQAPFTQAAKYVDVDDGVTVAPIDVVNPASEYHVKTPVAQLPLKVELAPEHIVEGLAARVVGAIGVAVTFTITDAEGLSHIPLTHDA